MVRRQVVSYTVTCDVCGGEIPDSDTGESSRQFSWNRADYQVDVCSRHQVQLIEILDQLKGFVDAGSVAAAGRARGGQTGASRPQPATGNDVGVIRAWAQENGHAVGDRGRLPARLIAAYHEAQGSETEAPATRARRARKTPAPSAD